MVEEIDPSSYKCDCGHVCEFHESTVREIKMMSMRKKIRLSDSAQKVHTIIFQNGRAIKIICPHKDCKNK